MRKRIAIIACVLLVTTLFIAAKPWTTRQTKAHDIAQLARELGLPEDNAIIQEAQFLWWCETEDARIVAAVLMGECINCSDRHQQLTACTVYNRVKDTSGNFPDTVRGVVEQKGQYSPSYTRNLPCFFEGNDDTQRCFRNAYAAFMGLVECPANVIYASEFPPGVLGSGCYETSVAYVEGKKYSTTYFNYR